MVYSEPLVRAVGNDDVLLGPVLDLVPGLLSGVEELLEGLHPTLGSTSDNTNMSTKSSSFIRRK